MDTPVCDFAARYAQSGSLRLHMPGHKGQAILGPEPWDLTEIPGADSLYEADGILRRSQENASALFGCPTFYSAEGSSQCIRAMVFLAAQDARSRGNRPLIAAARNAHKTFLTAAALLDVPVRWLYSQPEESYLSCQPGPEDLERAFAQREKPTAVYITTPDYLGNQADVAALAAVCRKHGALLLVDNAHGAYLRFLPEPAHPMDLGADLCCDSAHKTLPVLTGGAYLHIGTAMPEGMVRSAPQAMGIFGSTSPSYLIMQSLDRANAYLAGAFRRELEALLPRVASLKNQIQAMGYELTGTEPLKITLAPKSRGYTGTELAELLARAGIVCEFADPDFLVMMVSPQLPEGSGERILSVLETIPPRTPISERPPRVEPGELVLSPREAMFSPWEILPVEHCLSRVLAAPSVGCPPAVPLAVCGERITRDTLACFAYYGIRTCIVTAEPRPI